MRDLYYIDEPAAISFSGGRISAYMLYRILEVHGGLSDNHRIVFANTGKEMPQTLDFVKRCGDEWGVKINWVERFATKNNDPNGNKYLYQTREVTHRTASRNGEPFRALVLARRYAPNPVARFCTQDMKIRAIREFMEGEGFETPILAAIGIRADEAGRAVKMNGRVESGQECYLPLYLDGVTKEDVYEFWRSNNFDLELPNNNGITDWGNCDLVFKRFEQKNIHHP